LATARATKESEDKEEEKPEPESASAQLPEDLFDKIKQAVHEVLDELKPDENPESEPSEPLTLRGEESRMEKLVQQAIDKVLAAEPEKPATEDKIVKEPEAVPGNRGRRVQKTLWG
jgi:hypothetical protein